MTKISKTIYLAACILHQTSAYKRRIKLMVNTTLRLVSENVLKISFAPSPTNFFYLCDSSRLSTNWTYT